MAGLLPGLLPSVGLPGLGGLLGAPTPGQDDEATPVASLEPQDTEDADPTPGLSLITINPGQQPDAEETTSIESSPTTLPDIVQSTLQTITTPAPTPTEAASTTVSTSTLDTSATAEAASEGGGASTNMIPIVAGAAGGGLVLIFLVVMLITRSRRNKWPFNRSDSFDRLDDEMEKNQAFQQSKWDPSRDAGRISRFISNRQN